jgi:tetratricopeptide (TPR) repeat protein
MSVPDERETPPIARETPRVAIALVQRAQALITRRKFDEDERGLLRALAILHQTVGDEDLDYSVCLNNLGMLYHVRGDDDRAEPLLRQVVDIRRRAAGERHPLYLNSLQDLAEFFRSRDDLDQAALWQARADEVEKKIRDETNPRREP